jgi:hypothetical protein
VLKVTEGFSHRLSSVVGPGVAGTFQDLITISILNRVARRTKQSSQANAVSGPSIESPKTLIRSEISPPPDRRAGLATQTEDIHWTLRSPLPSAAPRHRSIRSAGLWTAAGPRFRTCV